MYASAMKNCGAMELCGLGFPRDVPMDTPWVEVMEQVKAQKAGVMLAWSRAHKPIETEFLHEQGFTPLWQFTNPRTESQLTLWLKDFTGEGVRKIEPIPIRGPRVDEGNEIYTEAPAIRPLSTTQAQVYAAWVTDAYPTLLD